MQNTTGVILTVGIRTPQDRAAIVLPLATDTTELDNRAFCANAAVAFEESCLDLLTEALGASAYVAYLQCVGMVDGMIPVRTDYGILDHPGQRTGPGECSQIAALTVFYCHPDDLTLGSRMRVGKNFIPGLSDTDVSGDYIVGAVQDALDAFLDPLLKGFVTEATPSTTWYRVLSIPKLRTPGQELKRIALGYTRLYVGTQRRRLIPRG